MYSNYTIKSYLDALSSTAPIPGGGSAAALVGATGASLLGKVANFTAGKKKYETVWDEMKEISARCESICKTLTQLSSQDAEAYKKLSVIFKMPKGDERTGKLQGALKEAMAVPLEICIKCHEAIKLAVPVAEKGNVNLW